MGTCMGFKIALRNVMAKSCVPSLMLCHVVSKVVLKTVVHPCLSEIQIREGHKEGSGDLKIGSTEGT